MIEELKLVIDNYINFHKDTIPPEILSKEIETLWDFYNWCVMHEF